MEALDGRYCIEKIQIVLRFWIMHVKFFYSAKVHVYTIPTQFVVCKLDHFWTSYNILKFLKLYAETASGRKFIRLLYINNTEKQITASIKPLQSYVHHINK
jgi:hypothetical protein